MRIAFPSHRSPALRRGTDVALVCAMLLLSLTWSQARAQTIQRYSDEDLAQHSSKIVEGTVADVHSDWNSDHNQIYTTVTLRVSRVIKGSIPPDGRVVLHMLGGSVGDITMDVIGQPAFGPGEDVIVFIDSQAPKLMPVTGLDRGKFTVAPDPSTGQPTVVGRGVSRDRFVRDLSRIVATQEGGR